MAQTEGAREVYMLAADMGGMGFIENNKALCMLTVLTSTHMLQAARDHGVERYFYSSSACVYAADKQTNTDITALKEADAYPAMPEDGYGWEKLFTERMCRHFLEDFGLATRVARYHNVYGPHGTWTGGREKAPAAICRKVATAAITGEHTISIWGDGEQTRSFMYVDDCVRGSQMILEGDSPEPVNLGSSELVSINGLVDIVEGIAGIRCEREYQLDAPQGVRGRNSDNTQILDDLRLGALDHAGRRSRADLPLGLRPGQALARLSGRVSMRILVHDYSGHPFQVELSAELARRGHDVTHSWCGAYVSGKGRLDDPASGGRVRADRERRGGGEARLRAARRPGAEVRRAARPSGRRRRPDVVLVGQRARPDAGRARGVPAGPADPVGAVAPGRAGRRDRSRSRETSSAGRSGSWPAWSGAASAGWPAGRRPWW